MKLDKRETATILAALRLFQEELDHYEPTEGHMAIDIGEREHFVDVEPLTSDEIDELCEKINFGSR